ncbi:hypothetical protein SAMN05421505_14725 [Sinosporangium album]|uniref:HNH endonuclease n=1 Tax=Sinosporangium album TaxID=504805 RepID=A0A1G8K4A8_9ACTN|nr:hypothetical protein [Sinosporangium album]SDI38243.1 hypothetical protein SAMN05421505_14725 [Sinosporangium album]
MAALPSWQDQKLGTMKRTALWLLTDVGVGNTFTKDQLRDAFPGVAQVDRRMRDLRDFGWRIDTSREDAALLSNEQRFVAPGDPVWEPGKATRKKVSHSVNAAQRRDVLTRDGHLCRSCGVPAGHPYSDTFETAQLDIARRVVTRRDGTEEVQLVIECNRCRVGGRGLATDLRPLLESIARLPELDQRILKDWIEKERRDFSELEKLWARYQTLPADARAEVHDALR